MKPKKPVKPNRRRKPKNITLSDSAWAYYAGVAEKEGTSISQAIEKAAIIALERGDHLTKAEAAAWLIRTKADRKK
jgi:hypothetical protein